MPCHTSVSPYNSIGCSSVWLPRGFSFLSGFPTEKRKRRVLVPFQLMGDDSGTKGATQHTVMGGLIGSAEQWASFADRWQACLDASPSIRYFSLKHAKSQHGQFSGFTEKQRTAKLAGLADALAVGMFRWLSVTVDNAEYDRRYGSVDVTLAATANPGRAVWPDRVARAPQSPYFYAYHAFISCACIDLYERGEREPFEFIVDEQMHIGRRAKLYYPVMRNLMREPQRSIMPVEPIPRDDQKFLPLQAADMIAVLTRMGAGGDHRFGWLWRHLAPLVPASRSIFADRKWFDFVHTLTEQRREEVPHMPIEAAIELARLQGAPIGPPVDWG